ncbi:hypothetical protein Cmaq_0799 [Caldivirga maquilingensis IC-167]|uniref:Uncharacterized protein n=2 Tax=Caldivirga maquilingensis TaxID=76887 RepID=A8MCX8_CALMQ|nr:hypothetical protein Cmaq_0799 [Caldivirga maquilingensis IC-167]
MLNKYLKIGFTLGLVTVFLALMLLLGQYSLIPITLNHNCSSSLTMNITGNVYLILNNTGLINASLTMITYQNIPQTNITVPQEYNFTITRLNSTRLVFLDIRGIEINCSSSYLFINLYAVKRPLYYYPAWILMLFSFLISIALIIMGYIELIEAKVGDLRS